MKKNILFLAFVLLLVGSLQAQFELKALVGTNFSSISHPPTGYKFSAKPGYQFGAGLLIGDKFYVEPGIQFVRNSKTVTTGNTDVKFDQNFVKIPVYAGYHILGSEENNLIALRVFAGPAAYIAGKLKSGDDQITKDDIKNMNWMFDAGLGLDILFFFVEANYEVGLNKLFTKDNWDSKHRAVVLNAGIHIDF